VNRLHSPLHVLRCQVEVCNGRSRHPLDRLRRVLGSLDGRRVRISGDDGRLVAPNARNSFLQHHTHPVAQLPRQEVHDPSDSLVVSLRHGQALIPGSPVDPGEGIGFVREICQDEGVNYGGHFRCFS